jgi:ketosteroid isomerase-like protein
MDMKKRLAKAHAWPLALALWLVPALALAAGAKPAAAAPASAQATDPVAVVDAFHAAGDDMDAALALLTDDVVIELVPPPPNTTGKWTGKEEVKAFFEWKKSLNQNRERRGEAQVTTDGSGSVVSGNIGVTSDAFKMWGLGPVAHTFRAIVENGKLKYYHGELAPEEVKRVNDARLAFQQAQATDRATVATTFLNSLPGDPEVTLGLMTDDAVARIVPPPPGTSGVWSGKEELRQWNAFRKGQASSIQVVGSPQVDGNKITLKVMIETNNFRNWGVGAVEHTYEIVVEGGKVKSLTSTMAPSERDRVQAAAAAYLAANPPTGMPRTGGPPILPFIFAIGTVMLMAGAALRRRKA